MTIETALARHTDLLMALPGVVGVAQGESASKPAINVLVVRRTPNLDARLPRVLDGFPVVVVETGEIRAQDSSARRRCAAPGPNLRSDAGAKSLAEVGQRVGAPIVGPSSAAQQRRSLSFQHLGDGVAS